MAKNDDVAARPIAGRLGPPPQTILRGGTHADKRRKNRAEQKRLAIREAFSFRGVDKRYRGVVFYVCDPPCCFGGRVAKPPRGGFGLLSEAFSGVEHLSLCRRVQFVLRSVR